MNGPILVINPNSNPAVTAGLDAAIMSFRMDGSPPIECLTVSEGPFGIESQADSDAAVAPMIALIRARTDASAVIIACYSDPGIGFMIKSYTLRINILSHIQRILPC